MTAQNSKATKWRQRSFLSPLRGLIFKAKRFCGLTSTATCCRHFVAATIVEAGAEGVDMPKPLNSVKSPFGRVMDPSLTGIVVQPMQKQDPSCCYLQHFTLTKVLKRFLQTLNWHWCRLPGLLQGKQRPLRLRQTPQRELPSPVGCSFAWCQRS